MRDEPWFTLHWHFWLSRCFQSSLHWFFGYISFSFASPGPFQSTVGLKLLEKLIFSSAVLDDSPRKLLGCPFCVHLPARGYFDFFWFVPVYSTANFTRWKELLGAFSGWIRKLFGGRDLWVCFSNFLAEPNRFCSKFLHKLTLAAGFWGCRAKTLNAAIRKSLFSRFGSWRKAWKSKRTALAGRGELKMKSEASENQ